MNEKLEALNQEIEKTEKKLRRAQHEEKILEHQIKTLTRKERTHRLCTRAAMLESYLPHPEAITDEQVSLFLKLLFRQDSIRQLMEKVNETVNLCVAQNFDMVVMAQQVSWQILRLDSIIGSSFPIYPSASGKVYCAFLEESELLKFLNELRETRPELTTDDINRFCTELAAIRREGVGFDCEEIFTGVRCVAAPIFDYTGNLVATIGCSVPTVRITEESSALLIREVIQTAAAISMSIGAPRREFMPTTRTMLHCPVRG